MTTPRFLGVWPANFGTTVSQTLMNQVDNENKRSNKGIH